MTEEDVRKNRQLSPPYAPWTEMKAALHRLRGFSPPRVDIAFLQTYGIAPKNERAVLNALKFLGLIDSEGIPTARLTRLQMGEEGYSKHLSTIVREAYADLFGRVYLKDADQRRILNYFLTQKVGPSVAPKCTRFFIGISKEAGFDIFPDTAGLPQRRGRRRSTQTSGARGATRLKERQKQGEPRATALENYVAHSTGDDKDGSALLLEAKLRLFEKLPNFDASWKPEAIKLVFREFHRLADRLEAKVATEEEALKGEEAEKS